MIFVIPKSQQMTFKQLDGNQYLYNKGLLQYVGMQNFDNRLLLDEIWQSVQYNKKDTLKVDSSDPILIQVTTDYVDVNNLPLFQIQCFDVNNNLLNLPISTNPIFFYLDGTGNVVFNISIAANLFSQGLYYFIISSRANTNGLVPVVFVSEVFEIGDFATMTLVQWHDSDRDGILWDGATIFGMRAELGLEYTDGNESSIYEGFNFEYITEYDVAKRAMQIFGDPMARYKVEKLQLAFAHSMVYVNNILVNKNGKNGKISKKEFSNSYTFEITVWEVNYENYTSLETISGTAVSTGEWIDNAGNKMLDNAGNFLIN